jgi:hypothetical protein
MNFVHIDWINNRNTMCKPRSSSHINIHYENDERNQKSNTEMLNLLSEQDVASTIYAELGNEKV